MVECVEGAQPKNFPENNDATKTSSFSLQGRNRAAPVGDEESWGIQQHQQFFSYSCVISGVCLALGEALFVFSRWAGGTG